MSLLRRLAHEYVDDVLKRLSLFLEINRRRCRLVNQRGVHLSDPCKLLYRNLHLRDIGRSALAAVG